MASKDWKELFRKLRNQGFTISPTKSGHHMIRDAAGRTVTVVPSTASDHRAVKNALAVLKRAGFDPTKK